MLDLTQSGLSRQLAAFEAHLGKPLFSRAGPGVELTDAGKLLLESAKAGYAPACAALDTVLEKEGVTLGNVRVTTVHSLSYDFTADVLSIFAGTRPQVNISCVRKSTRGSSIRASAPLQIDRR
jgi:DNA-binding transcriptional LysR family regulator